MSSKPKEASKNDIKSDISDYKLVEKIIPNVDTVINVATETHINRSMSDPEIFLQSSYAVFGICFFKPIVFDIIK